MSSNSLHKWKSARLSQLDEIEGAHRQVGGTGRGRRYATQQINHAYTMLLSSQFQGFCRDLHTETADYLIQPITQSILKDVLRLEFALHRKLDRGNPNPANINADFNRFGFNFLDEIRVRSPHNDRRLVLLQELADWRNAIAHQDFDQNHLRGRINLRKVRGWRQACDQLAVVFDSVIRDHIAEVVGNRPW